MLVSKDLLGGSFKICLKLAIPTAIYKSAPEGPGPESAPQSAF